MTTQTETANPVKSAASSTLTDPALNEIAAARCRYGCTAIKHAAEMVDEIRRLRREIEALQAAAADRAQTDYTRYEPGPDQDGLATLWCVDCEPSLDGVRFPIWVQPRMQVTPLSLANLIAAADEHERLCPEA